MIIRFKVGEYDEICDEYEVLFEYAEPLETNEKDGNSLVVRNKRIVIPQLHASFREADWYARNTDIEDPDDEEAWDVQDSVIVEYGETEKDINNYVSFATCTFWVAVADICNKVNIPNPDDLDCYIDTSEFVDEKIVRQLFPKN